MKYAAFIPSAGAASRYYALIKNLLLAIENGDKASLEKSKIAVQNNSRALLFLKKLKT